MASESKYLIVGTQYLRDNTIINDNVDAQVLQPIIRAAQTKYIQQVIGDSLYSKIIADIQSNTISGNYKILVDDYIIPVLLQYIVYEAVPFMTFKFRNKSISKQGSDNSTPAELTDLEYLRNNILPTAQFYAERLRNYLCNNSSLFPEYTQYSTDINPNPNNYFNGIHIPRSCNNYNNKLW